MGGRSAPALSRSITPSATDSAYARAAATASPAVCSSGTPARAPVDEAPFPEALFLEALFPEALFPEALFLEAPFPEEGPVSLAVPVRTFGIGVNLQVDLGAARLLGSGPRIQIATHQGFLSIITTNLLGKQNRSTPSRCVVGGEASADRRQVMVLSHIS
jgi:hypothetical protein